MLRRFAREPALTFTTVKREKISEAYELRERVSRHLLHKGAGSSLKAIHARPQRKQIREQSSDARRT
jgi:hypothetical protein